MFASFKLLFDLCFDLVFQREASALRVVWNHTGSYYSETNEKRTQS